MTHYETAEDIAEHFSMHVETIRRKARNGEIPCVHFGREVRFVVAEVDAALRGEPLPDKPREVVFADGVAPAPAGSAAQPAATGPSPSVALRPEGPAAPRGLSLGGALSEADPAMDPERVRAWHAEVVRKANAVLEAALGGLPDEAAEPESSTPRPPPAREPDATGAPSRTVTRDDRRGRVRAGEQYHEERVRAVMVAMGLDARLMGRMPAPAEARELVDAYDTSAPEEPERIRNEGQERQRRSGVFVSRVMQLVQAPALPGDAGTCAPARRVTGAVARDPPRREYQASARLVCGA